MPILPLTSLYDYKRARYKEDEDKLAKAGVAFGGGLLSLDELRREREKVALDQENKLKELGLKDRGATVDERGATVDERRQTEIETAGAADREASARKEEALRLESQEKARKTGVKELVAGARGKGITSFEDYTDLEEPGLLDIGEAESPRREIAGEFQTQGEEAAALSEKNEIERAKAEAARMNAARPRPVSQPRPPRVNPYGGLLGGERSRVAYKVANRDILNGVLSEVESGKVDSGFLQNLWLQGTRMVGLRDAGDAEGAAKIADSMAVIMNDRYGAALTGQELSRAVQYVPDFKDNPRAIVSLLRVARDRYQMEIDAIVDVAARDAAARGQPTNLGEAFQGVTSKPPAEGVVTRPIPEVAQGGPVAPMPSAQQIASKEGKIHVKKIETGATGWLSPQYFDPAKYERIP